MKKIAFLLFLLLAVGVLAMAEDAIPTCGDLFSDIATTPMNLDEMALVVGGQNPDMDGSVGMYSRHSRITIVNSDYIPTKTQARESAARFAGDVASGVDVAAAGVAVVALFAAQRVSPAIGFAATVWGASRALQGCSNRR